MDSRQTVLVLVHPGSACGSAASLLGNGLSSDYRQAIAEDLKRHDGDVLVLDGFLSDELPDYPKFNRAIEEAVKRTEHSMRQFACDNEGEHFTVLLPRIIQNSIWNDPSKFRFNVTGAWYFRDDSSGCVNGVCQGLRALGFDADVLDSAVPDPEGDGFGEDDEEE